MSKTKELWWVSVGGNNCEPAVVVSTVDGHHGIPEVQIFTFGCADPLTTKQAVMVEQMEQAPDTPEKAKKKKAAADAYWEAERKAGRVHGYRTFP